MPALLDWNFQTNIPPHLNWTKNKVLSGLMGTMRLFPAAHENFIPLDLILKLLVIPEWIR